MQPLAQLSHWLSKNASSHHHLFTLQSLRPLFPEHSNGAYKSLMSRAVKSGILIRICRGIYLAEHAAPKDGLLLYRVAGLLRLKHFNYLSLETVLSAHGIISQIPTHWITLMSSGRSNIIDCGPLGHIEYIHTTQKAGQMHDMLNYDADTGLWRANVKQAIRDMKRTHRKMDLIDWELANELI